MKRYCFLQLFRNLFNNIWKKIFDTNFPFLQPILPNPPNPLNDQNQLSIAKVCFFYCFLAAPRSTFGYCRRDSFLDLMLMIMFCLFWLKSHPKPLKRKFFVNTPLEGWLPPNPSLKTSGRILLRLLGKVVARVFLSTDWPFRVSLKNSSHEKFLKIGEIKMRAGKERTHWKVFVKILKNFWEHLLHLSTLEKTTIAK